MTRSKLSLSLSVKDGHSDKYDLVSYKLPRRYGYTYCDSQTIASQLPEWEWSGQAWKYHKHFFAYKPRQGTIFKNLKSLKPESEEDFHNIMSSCCNAGISPPSSFADIFSKVCHVTIPKPSATSLLHRESYGGWQQNFVKGHCRGKLYHYDLISAYRWAACQGLPDVTSIYPVFRVEDDWDVFFGTVETPPWYAISNRIQLWTREEIERAKLTPKLFLRGYGFSRWLDFTGIFAEIQQRFPYCFKRISRAFWGRWNTIQNQEQCSWPNKKLKVSLRKNHTFNPFLSKYITSRVKLRILETVVQAEAVHVFVDSVLCYQPIPTGDQVGDWSLKGEYDGVRVWAPGVWGTSTKLVKHAGMTEAQGQKFCLERSPLI